MEMGKEEKVEEKVEEREEKGKKEEEDRGNG